MMHCPACAKDVHPAVDAIPGPSGSPIGARFVNKCPSCEQVLGPAQSGQGETVSVASNYDHLPADKRSFSPPAQGRPQGTQIAPGFTLPDATPMTATATSAIVGATGEQITARARARLEALEAIVPGLTAERAMLRRMLKAAAPPRGRVPQTNVVSIDRTRDKTST